MHIQAEQFVKRVKKLYPHFFYLSKVLECGSLNINGSVRKHFWFCDYTGIDVGMGRCVDLVTAAHLYERPNTFDVVISTEMLEHDIFWRSSLTTMYNNLKDGGIMIITCASPGRPEHGTSRTSPQDSPFTTDYYRNLSGADLRSVLDNFKFTNPFYDDKSSTNFDTYFCGIKGKML